MCWRFYWVTNEIWRLRQRRKLQHTRRMNHMVPFCLFWGLTASVHIHFHCNGKVQAGDPAKKKENHFERHEYMIESLFGSNIPLRIFHFGKKLILSSIAIRVALSETRAPLNSQSKLVPTYIFSLHSQDDSFVPLKSWTFSRKVGSCTQNTLNSQSLSHCGSIIACVYLPSESKRLL